jgi:hypothetical protein
MRFAVSPDFDKSNFLSKNKGQGLAPSFNESERRADSVIKAGDVTKDISSRSPQHFYDGVMKKADFTMPRLSNGIAT